MVDIKYLKWIPFYGKRYLGQHITDNRWLFAFWLYLELILLYILVMLKLIF